MSDIREGELKEVFDALEEAFHAKQIDFYLIGALARNIWYSRGSKGFRTTKDLDFAVMISNKDDYEAVRSYLIAHKGFRATKGNSFIMISPEGVEIDILPFGEIEIDDEIKLSETGLTSIKVNGFMEVYQAGTEDVLLKTGHNFKVATLPAIVMLKLIAYDDRPEIRLKDARDIINILTHYFDLQAEMIYEHHTDLFGEDEGSLSNVSAIVIGREMKKIVVNNDNLYQRLEGILTRQIELKENSAFIRNMVNENNSNVEDIILLLKNLLKGFIGTVRIGLN
ncbi:MAG: nucleotidyl transferase AbiEii/AbiGii toxin family protein [Mucilaginibacter sp.]